MKVSSMLLIESVDKARWSLAYSNVGIQVGNTISCGKVEPVVAKGTLFLMKEQFTIRESNKSRETPISKGCSVKVAFR